MRRRRPQPRVLTEHERLWLETTREAVLIVIRARFPDAPARIEGRVARVRSLRRLDRWLVRAAVANSLEEIERLLGS